MAKRPKVKRFSIQSYDMAHYKTTDQYTKFVGKLFDTATKAITQAAAKGTYNPDKPFSFDDYPKVKGVLQKETEKLASQMTTAIESGSKKQWLFACKKNDGFIASIMDTSKLKKSTLNKMQDRNLDALATFQQRKVDGMDLSQRVWKYVGQYKEQMQDALDVGLGEGKSAQELARDVKQNLQEPNRLFRRVRDKRGNLQLSKNAAAYHPGRGVYRSSVKNAQRLTRSEINMAYRESDYQRWQQLDFVVGFEVCRSNHQPLCKCDLCENLKGQYPKQFKFKGWHPQCMCYAIPIMADEQTIDDNELGELKAALNGTTYNRKVSANTIIDVPQGMKDWMDANKDKQGGWGSIPYFVRDNFKDGDLSKGLGFDLTSVRLQVQKAIAETQGNDPIQQQMDAMQADIENARLNADKWGLVVQLSMLDQYVSKRDIAGIRKRLQTINDKVEELEQKEREARAMCADWGVNAFELDSAMKNKNLASILTAFDTLKQKCEDAERQYKSYITEATKAVSDAKKLKLNITDYDAVERDVNDIRNDKREWVMSQVVCKQRLADLLTKINAANNPGKEPTKIQGSIQGIKNKGVEYRKVKEHKKQPTETELIARVGGGDKTEGSCSSLAFAWAANRAGMDVLDFRDGDSRKFFASGANIMAIVTKCGGQLKMDVTGMQLVADAVVDKEYYVAWGQHAAIVRKVKGGKYEYLELQSGNTTGYTNGWHPLNAEKFKWRFGWNGKTWGCIIEIGALSQDSGYKELMGYINTQKSKQVKGTTGTIK